MVQGKQIEGKTEGIRSTTELPLKLETRRDSVHLWSPLETAIYRWETKLQRNHGDENERGGGWYGEGGPRLGRRGLRPAGDYRAPDIPSWVSWPFYSGFDSWVCSLPLGHSEFCIQLTATSPVSGRKYNSFCHTFSNGNPDLLLFIIFPKYLL